VNGFLKGRFFGAKLYRWFIKANVKKTPGKRFLGGQKKIPLTTFFGGETFVNDILAV